MSLSKGGGREGTGQGGWGTGGRNGAMYAHMNKLKFFKKRFEQEESKFEFIFVIY
jgi:hypothetical protein